MAGKPPLSLSGFGSVLTAGWVTTYFSVSAAASSLEMRLARSFKGGAARPAKFPESFAALVPVKLTAAANQHLSNFI